MRRSGWGWLSASQRANAKTWRMAYVPILKGVWVRMLVYSIVLSCRIGRDQVRGGRPMRVAKCSASYFCPYMNECRVKSDLKSAFVHLGLTLLTYFHAYLHTFMHTYSGACCAHKRVHPSFQRAAGTDDNELE